VEVRRDDYEDGVLPQLCVLTGAPAEVLLDHRSRSGGGAVTLLLLLLGPLGVVAMIVVDRLLEVEARGQLPVSRAAMAERTAARHRANAVARVGAVVAVAGVGVAVLAGSSLRLAGLAAAVAGLVVVVVAFGWPAWSGVQGRPDRAGRTVTLVGVSAQFARAYRAQDERRAEARRLAVLGTATRAASSSTR